MSGKILSLARTDSNRILKNMGFQTDITITKADNSMSVTVKGLGISHHLNFDTDGLAVNSNVARATIYESDLVALGFETRKNGIVYLKDSIVEYADAFGNNLCYNVAENFADEMLGTIVLSLQKYDK